MFKKNTAVVGFPIGHFINASTGAAVTTGTPTCKRILDGTGAACANAASYNTDAAQWEIDLAQADTNGDMVGLSFTLTDCLPISYGFRTGTKLVSDLNDVSTAQVNAEADTALADVGLTTTVTGRIDAAVSTRSSHSAADVWEYATRTLSAFAFGVTVTTNNDKTGYALTTTPPTAADIATAVWGATTRTLSSYGTLVADVAAAVWGATTRLLSGPVETDTASRNASKADTTGLALEATSQSILDGLGSVSVELGPEDTTAIVEGVVAGIAGTGTVYVDHNTLDDEADNMKFKDSGGAGIGGATVTAYVATEYAAGNYMSRGSTITLDNGTWASPLRLNDGIQYVIEFDRDGFETATTTVTVAAPEA